MQNLQYQGNMGGVGGVGGNTTASAGGGNPWVKFLLGLFTGAGIAAPVTALIVKKVCDKDKAQAISAAVEEAEYRGIQAGISVAVSQSKEYTRSAPGAIPGPNRGISKGGSTNSQKTEENRLANGSINAGAVDIPVYLEHEKIGGVNMANDAIQKGVNQIGMFEMADIPKDVIEKIMPDGKIVEHYILTREEAKAILNQNLQNDPAVKDEAYLASLQAPQEDPEGVLPGGLDYDIENYDLKISDEEATEDAAEFSAQHIQYLDMVQQYKNRGGDVPPMTISREQFDNEHFYQKSYVNWYPEDDVFEEDNAKIEDPGYYFGFVSGHDMFAPERTANRDDPDICYIRHMGSSTDFEITRMSGSYQQNVDEAEVYYHGDTGSLF